MIEVLDPEATEIQRELRTLQETIKEQRDERARLYEIKKPLDKKAERAASRILFVGLGGMVAHLCIVARLTWWELSWDIVEPITYMITYTTAVSLFIYFCTTKKEYNYESLFQRMVEKRKKKIYKRNDFDIVAYEKLCHSIEENSLKIEKLQIGLPPHAIFANPDSDKGHLILTKEGENGKEKVFSVA